MSGLYYYGIRYYDPSIGRWYVPDPLWGLSPQISPYAYCANNPINFIDPIGMDTTATQNNNEDDEDYVITEDGLRLHRNIAMELLKIGFLTVSTTADNTSVSSDNTQNTDESNSQDNEQGYTTGSKIGLSLTGLATTGMQLSKVQNNMWRSPKTGKWYFHSFKGGGPAGAGSRTAVFRSAAKCRLGGVAMFGVSATISSIEGWGYYRRGDWGGVTMSGINIGVSGYATFGGPPGLALGIMYFATDGFKPIRNIYNAYKLNPVPIP